MSDTPQLDVLSLPEANIRWGSFGRDEHIQRRIKHWYPPPICFFSVMATMKNIPDIFLMIVRKLPTSFATTSS
jgi:hypothetical protein